MKPIIYNTLMIIGGLFWSITYILSIGRGFKDKTYGMPLAALCANISWEGMFYFIYPHSPPQLYIDYAWFLIDVFILMQFLKYGRSEFSFKEKIHCHALACLGYLLWPCVLNNQGIQ